jgi:hypothetical protein
MKTYKKNIITKEAVQGAHSERAIGHTLDRNFLTRMSARCIALP